MNQHLDVEKYYEILGLEPHASAPEVKAAYRDLAKVWHPDRFTHDPRLQQKAQEKLKEINDAYQQLAAVNFTPRPRATRPTSTPPPQASTTSSSTTSQEDLSHAVRRHHRTGPHKWLYAALFVLAFVATWLLVFPQLSRSHHDLRTTTTSTDLAPVAGAAVKETKDVKDQFTDARQEQQGVGKRKVLEKTSEPNAAAAPVALRPLPTVTVMIDPSTNLIATAACPSRVSMTYPSGQEPHQYCRAKHQTSEPATETPTEEQKKSRLKSVAGRLVSPSKWFQKKKDQPATQTKAPSVPREGAPQK